MSVIEYILSLPWWTPICVISSKREAHTFGLLYVKYGSKYTGHKKVSKTFIHNNERVIIVDG